MSSSVHLMIRSWHGIAFRITGFCVRNPPVTCWFPTKVMFRRCPLEHAVDKRVAPPVIWDAMTFVWLQVEEYLGEKMSSDRGLVGAFDYLINSRLQCFQVLCKTPCAPQGKIKTWIWVTEKDNDPLYSIYVVHTKRFLSFCYWVS